MKKLHDETIQVRLATVPGWEHVGDMLVRTWQFASDRRGLEFVNQAWAVADRLKHYPEIVLSYRTVRIEVNSRDAGGLTDRDFQLATELNALPDDR
ncbi:4a-hydroxytetrahydrobiopterin dehydratase [Tautonia sp. JC769]|uniref:4a-hydroxytetrahydrobiopterin dehydratase n=1 Tax=Tautonia sp. JC769 TaxID=3232135 RepID=UPI0034599E1E